LSRPSTDLISMISEVEIDYWHCFIMQICNIKGCWLTKICCCSCIYKFSLVGSLSFFKFPCLCTLLDTTVSLTFCCALEGDW
jgi:hypothetical protein